MPDAAELVRLLAMLVIAACAIGLSPNPCGHAECAAQHKANTARDRETERRKQHESWHHEPEPGCDYCRRDAR